MSKLKLTFAAVNEATFTAYNTLYGKESVSHQGRDKHHIDYPTLELVAAQAYAAYTGRTGDATHARWLISDTLATTEEPLRKHANL